MNSNLVIKEKPNYVTVIVHLEFNPEDIDKVLDLSKQNLPIFAKQKGFISSALHVGKDGKSIVNYMQWETAEDHFACMKSPDFDEIGTELMEMIQSGKIKFSVDVYDLIEITHSTKV